MVPQESGEVPKSRSRIGKIPCLIRQTARVVFFCRLASAATADPMCFASPAALHAQMSGVAGIRERTSSALHNALAQLSAPIDVPLVGSKSRDCV